MSEIEITREQILSMPSGPELDALVAQRVMGWTRVRDDDQYGDWWGIDFDGRPEHQAGIHRVSRWSPSTDTLIAMNLFWTMLELIGCASITADMEDYGREPGRICTVEFRNGDIRVSLTGDFEATISRAALLMTLEQES